MRVISELSDTGRGLVENRLRLGVTGLSSAGKTVFVTALVQALQYPQNLSRLPAVRDGRFRAAVLRPQPSQDLPRFPFEDNAGRLTGALGEPTWPPGTRRTSELRLSIRYRPRGVTGRLGERILHLDLFDYPGEWLIDLGLLQHDYASWSEAMLDEMAAPDAPPAARAYLDFIDNLQPDAADPDAEGRAIQAARLFGDYLEACQACRGRASLHHPGRFLLPGDYAGSPLLTFAPLPPRTSAHPARKYSRGRRNTLRALMRQRFDAYLSSLVVPFQRDHFARLDRQVVLVDLIGHIAEGADTLGKLDREVEAVQRAMRIGSSWLPRALRPGIDRVLFAASKADHLPCDQHAQLVEALRTSLTNSLRGIRFRGARCEAMALSALRATREMTAPDRPGRTFLAGRPTDGREEIAHFPGAFDPGLSDPAAGFRPQAFRAPEGLRRDAAWPHLGLDGALEFLIGDRL